MAGSAIVKDVGVGLRDTGGGYRPPPQTIPCGRPSSLHPNACTLQPLSNVCWNVSLTRGLQSNLTTLSLTVFSSLLDSCRVQLAMLQQPLYLRLPLSMSGLSLVGAFSPSAGGLATQDAHAADLSWAFMPSWANSFTYTVQVPRGGAGTCMAHYFSGLPRGRLWPRYDPGCLLALQAPGVWAVSDLCAQGSLAGQLPDTCAVQIYAGANDTLWQGWVGPQLPPAAPLPPLPPGVSPSPGGGSSGLSYNQKVAIIVCSVVGGILLLALLALLLLFCHKRRQRKWKPAKGPPAGAAAAGGPPSPLAEPEAVAEPERRAAERQAGPSEGAGVGPQHVALTVQGGSGGAGPIGEGLVRISLSAAVDPAAVQSHRPARPARLAPEQ
jgi:hypothetical protein